MLEQCQRMSPGPSLERAGAGVLGTRGSGEESHSRTSPLSLLERSLQVPGRAVDLEGPTPGPKGLETAPEGRPVHANDCKISSGSWPQNHGVPWDFQVSPSRRGFLLP